MITKKLKEWLINDEYRTLDYFFSINQESTKKFRYFQKRSYDIILNHIFTCLYFEDNECIGYGHLDNDNDKIWLGIIVDSKFIGKGIGSFIIQDLIKQTTEDIFLSVDKNNERALNLYIRNGFIFYLTTDNHYVMIYKQKK